MLYCESHQLCIRLQIGTGIFAVPTADILATGEVICYNVIENSLTPLTLTVCGDDKPGVQLHSATTPGLRGRKRPTDSLKPANATCSSATPSPRCATTRPRRLRLIRRFSRATKLPYLSTCVH